MLKKGTKAMCLIGFAFLLNTYNINAATQVQSSSIDAIGGSMNVEATQTPELESRIDSIQTKYENDKKESDRLNAEKQKQEEIKKQKQESVSTPKEDEHDWQEFTLTFYTSLEEENSSAGAVTCQGKKLERGMVANNVYSLGTEIYLGDYGTRTVSDRGGKNFNTNNRLDVFVARKDGESNAAYKKRVSNLGIVKVKGYIIKK